MISNLKFDLGGVVNIVRKGENACYQHACSAGLLKADCIAVCSEGINTALIMYRSV